MCFGYYNICFGLRNKKNNFQVLTLIWGPDLFEVSHHAARAEIFIEKLEKRQLCWKHTKLIYYNLCSLCSLKVHFLTVANVLLWLHATNGRWCVFTLCCSFNTSMTLTSAWRRWPWPFRCFCVNLCEMFNLKLTFQILAWYLTFTLPICFVIKMLSAYYKCTLEKFCHGSKQYECWLDCS